MMNQLLRRVALLSLTAALTAAMAQSASAAVYSDVKTSDWFSPAVQYVVQKGLFSGVGASRFAPREPMSRAMFYTVLSRIASVEPNNCEATNLADVPAGRWYTGAVIWALREGIADCRGDTVFGADLPITRAELCLALARYERAAGLSVLPKAGAATFPDLYAVDEETAHAIFSCQAAGIVEGRTDGRFDPLDTANRAEVAQMIQKFCRLPSMREPANREETPQLWDDVGGWTGELLVDFPLSSGAPVTSARVVALNRRILSANQPAQLAPLKTTLDGNPKHLTNYGGDGYYDCYGLSTILFNKNNNVEAGTPLFGQQEYYGYTLQVDGVSSQDIWHRDAERSGKQAWQCTWWVWGRAAQYLELAHGLNLADFCCGQDNPGHGRDYYASLSRYFLSDRTPAANSVVSWTCGDYGHVAYVEAVDDGGIWVTMADSGHSWRGVTYIPRVDNPDNPYPLYWYPAERLNGFNHLDFSADGTPIS